MTSRPGRRAAVLLAGTWVLGAAIAIAIGYFAIDRVGRDVNDPTPAAATAPPASPVTTPATTTATTTATTSAAPAPGPPPSRTHEKEPPTTTAPTGAAPASRPFTVTGGVVAVSCSGRTITLLYAYPDDGFTSEVNPEDRKVEVQFKSATAESHLTLRCVAGAPVAATEDEGR